MTIKQSTTEIVALDKEISTVQTNLDIATRNLLISRQALEEAKRNFELEMNRQQAEAQQEYVETNKKALEISGKKETLVGQVEKMEFNYDPLFSANRVEVERLEDHLSKLRNNQWELQQLHFDQLEKINDQNDLLEKLEHRLAEEEATEAVSEEKIVEEKPVVGKPIYESAEAQEEMVLKVEEITDAQEVEKIEAEEK